MQNKLFLALLALVALRVLTFKYDYPEGVPIRITDRLYTEPAIYGDRRLVSIGGLKAYVNLYPEVNYGDIVSVEGIIEGNKIQKAKVVGIMKSEGVFRLRTKIISIFQRALPEPHSALAAGIVLGSKASLPEDFWNSLKLTGTAHVVVASGMNVTFTAGFLMSLFLLFMRRRKAVAAATVGTWIYVLLSGFEAPLIRAAIMGTLAFGAQAAGRVSLAIRALFISAAIMLLIKPQWFFDLGFIMSFTATLSLILFQPKIYRLIYKIPFIFKEDLATTIAAQIGVAPILYFAFGQFNILSPLINSLVLWTIPPIMIIGGVASVVGLVIPALGQAVALLILPFSFWFINVIKIFS